MDMKIRRNTAGKKEEGCKGRKGFFFSLDALIAVVLVISVLILVPVFYMKEEQAVQPVFFSSDIIQLLSVIRLGELNDLGVLSLINSSNITEMNRTVLEQVLRFQVGGEEEKARELLNLTVGGLVPDYYGMGIWVGGYEEPVYSSGQEEVSELISSKQMVSGIERGRAIEGLSARVFLSGISERVSSAYLYFGGYEGEGNITKKFNLPSGIEDTSIYMEMDINNNFSLYINEIFAGSFSPLNLDPNATADSWEIGNTTLLQEGDNIIELRFNDSDDSKADEYVGGGYFKITYTTSEIELETNKTRHQFPGIKGIINLYDSFYVPGILKSVMARLHYYNKYNIFFNIANQTVYRNRECDGEYVVELYDSNFSSLNYSLLSRKTIPIRLGTDAFELIEKAFNADVVLITDLSGSMQWRLDNSNTGTIRGCEDPSLYNSSTRRISLAKCLDKDFVRVIMNATGNRMGLVGFGSSADVYTPNLDYTEEQLLSQIDSYPDSPSGSTCICCAINRAYEVLSSSLYSMAIILPKKSSWLYNSFYPLPLSTPPDDENGNNWTSVSYNDSQWGNSSGWSSGSAILGFETIPYSPYIDTNISINSVVLGNSSYNSSQYSLINYSIISGGLSDTYFLDGSTFDIAYNPGGAGGAGGDGSGNIFYDGFESYYGDGAYRIDGNSINKAPGYWYIDDAGEEVYLMANYAGYPAYSGTDVLVFRDMDSYGYAETTINLSSYASPKLSYWWRLGPNGFDSGEYANVMVWDGSWHTLATYDGDDSDNSYHYSELGLSPYNKVSNFKIRFGAKSSIDDERFYVDEVRVKEELSPQPAEIWLNSTGIQDVPFDESSELSARVIFKSNSSVNYAMKIYNFETGEWESEGCDFGKVDANVWNDFWCFKSDASSYISNVSSNSSSNASSNMSNASNTSNRGKIRIGLAASFLEQTREGFEDGNIDGWSTGGGAIWYATNSVFYNGSWSARAGAISNNGESWIEKAVEGPLTLSFYWKVSSEQNYDYLRFYIDGSEESGISGEVNWEQKTYYLPSGPHTIRWRYTKDYIVSRGSDTGWVDDIIITKSEAKAFATQIDLVRYHTTTIAGNYYFRKEFTIDDKNAFSSARLYILSDDRAEVYLNSHLIDNDTISHNAEYWNRYKDINYKDINASYLVDGENIIAVKLYNKDDRSAKFDLQLEANSSRQRYIIVMSDGIAGQHCGDCGAGCSGSCSSTTGSYDCGGGSGDCTGSQCDTAINDAICSSCRAHNSLNSTVYSIGFGPVAGCYNANRTLRGIADCGNGEYYSSSDADELKGIYDEIAENILSANYQAQFINVSGTAVSSSILYPDSYIEFGYTPELAAPSYGLIPLTIESERFGNTITEGSFYVPDNVVVYNAKLTSYSGDKWTARASIKDAAGSWAAFFNLSKYGTDYLSLGDPYLIDIPPELVIGNRNNSVRIETAFSSVNTTGGSPDDRAIYTIGIDVDINYTGVFERAEGCLWSLQFEDGTNDVIPIPQDYSGDDSCVFDAATSCDDYNDDAIDNAVCYLFKQLDLDNDGRLFVKFGPGDLDIEIYPVGRIPFMWGPTVVEVRVWR